MASRSSNKGGAGRTAGQDTPNGIPLRTNELKPGGPASRRAAKEIALLAGGVPEVRQHVQNVLDFAITHDGGIKAAREGLIAVHKKFGSRILAQTAKVLDEAFGGRSGQIIDTVALYCSDGKGGVLADAAAFLDKHREPFWTAEFKSVVGAIDRCGVEGLERAMELTPRVDDPDPVLLPEDHHPEWEMRQRRQRFALVAGLIGLEGIQRLGSMLRKEGLCNRDVYSLVCGSALYYSGRERGAKLVSDAIALVKEAGLKPQTKGLVYSVFYTLMSTPFVSRPEIREVLHLAAEKHVESIGDELGLALQYYRKPSTRSYVVSAFDLGSPQLLARLRFAETFALLFVFPTNGVDPTLRRIEESDMQDAMARTQELMGRKYDTLGLFSQDRELVQALARNPIFDPKSLALRRSEARTPVGIVDQAARRFGKEEVRKVIRRAEQGEEAEYALALMRSGNAKVLLEALNRLPSDAHVPAVRVINNEGMPTLRRAVGIAESCGMDPRASLQPISAALASRSKELVPVRAIEFVRPLMPEHEQQVLFFLAQPPLWQRNMAIAVNAFRHVYSVTRARMQYG